MRYFKAILSFIFLFIFSITDANASYHDDGIRFGAQIGYGSGGDVLFTGVYEDGSTDTLKAGSGTFMGGTMTMHLGGVLYTKFGLSYLNDDIPASNADISFSRFPVDLLLVGRFEKFSLGVGITYHLNPDLTTELDNETTHYSYSIDNTQGIIAEANYRIIDKRFALDVGLRYTQIDYDVSYSYFGNESGSGAFNSDGSNVALTVGAAF